jgi:hypothetical protein
MFKVTVTDIEGLNFNLTVLFHEIKRIRKNKPVIDTICKIYLCGELGTTKLLAGSVAWQSPKDNYNKIIGEKIALTRALKQIDCLKSVPEIKTINLHRKLMRTKIWQAFHENNIPLKTNKVSKDSIKSIAYAVKYGASVETIYKNINRIK